jgi:hypothetical protein
MVDTECAAPSSEIKTSIADVTSIVWMEPPASEYRLKDFLLGTVICTSAGSAK